MLAAIKLTGKVELCFPNLFIITANGFLKCCGVLVKMYCASELPSFISWGYEDGIDSFGDSTLDFPEVIIKSSEGSLLFSFYPFCTTE